MSPNGFRFGRPVLSLAAVACVAALTVTTNPGPAYAATDQLALWLHPAGPVYRLVDPPAGCFPIRSGYTVVDNRLDTYVVAFQGDFCTGRSVRVEPGVPTQLDVVSHSVRVPR
ncbi:hypothetical protein O7626_40960 [Micromonospora sp. WMMD1102]|uniref:hypothetical protein n=1 Tax=Micromonospora sp. WMMD1102 TaxID=3016105 RepID=UPI00241531F1|nr:hypothetical protein [Micromonospora sp. WMMD1102]MDG4785701.1 hypothetical protein [Micromonospora sp. WMMD1102]MDG4792176.1 hypothetical protein [Micromonospora sp. WMMD1102]